jgi:hypothetical protein
MLRLAGPATALFTGQNLGASRALRAIGEIRPAAPRA